MTDHDDELAKMKELLTQIVEVDVSKELIRSAELGTADFKDVLPTLAQTIELFRELDSFNLVALPLDIIRQLSARVGAAVTTFDTLREFSLENPQMMPERENLINRVRTEYTAHFVMLTPHLTYLSVKQSNVTAMDAEVRQTIRQLDSYTAEKRTEQENIRKEMESALATVKSAASEAGVSQQSIVFGEQSISDQSIASRWLKLTIGLGILSFSFVAITMILIPPPTDSTAEVVRGISTRLVALSLLAFALGFAVRQYTASKHNETVNLHRHNALRTFETFVQAADDQETKDAVLLEATRSIFAAQPSGFLRGTKGAESPSTMIEIVRRVHSASSREG